MGALLTDDEFAEALRAFRSTAFRLELQRAYAEPAEAATVARFVAGEPEPPTEVPDLAEWFEQVTELVRQGRRIERVRVHDEPPTDYQRWERWIGTWNVEAGEIIHYLTRQQAHDAGLLPAAGNKDWWLLDDERLIIMRFDDDGHRTSTELVTVPTAVRSARAWRDLAVHAATGKSPDVAA